MTASVRKVRTNVSLDAALAERARALGLNVSAVTEAALRGAVRAAEATAWAEENREALRLREAWLDRNGHPLAEFMPDWAKDAWRSETGR